MDYRQIIIFWKEVVIPKVLERSTKITENTDFVITITGPRRAGKTYFCFQMINQLFEKGISKENVFYINFEDNKLLGADSKDLDKLIEFYFEMSQINKKQKIYLFLDEIQTVKNWDSWVRTVNDTRKNIQLVITGSSSKLLSKEISTKLRGRVLNYEIFPLSFREILNWENIKYDIKTISYSKDKTQIKKLFTSFVSNGGFPAVISQNLQKENILQSYYESMILKDIVERYKIEDVNKLRTLANLLFESVSKEISYSKLANKLNSIGFKISKNTVIEHLSHFEDAYLFFQNLKYEYSLAKQLGSIKKLYCIDNGLLNSVSFKFSEDSGKLLENLAFIELRRRNEQVYYFRKNYECDFLIVRKNKPVLAVQVTKKLDEDNEKREINGLMEAMKEHKLREGMILTEEQEEERIIEGKKITILPVWKWILIG
ncbi:ATP-binding protein [Candidatus Pacearchaeota archaeon]|nr:ATP-binding protein [Candidatus Pacearchaeota archaeon]